MEEMDEEEEWMKKRNGLRRERCLIQRVDNK